MLENPQQYLPVGIEKNVAGPPLGWMKNLAVLQSGNIAIGLASDGHAPQDTRSGFTGNIFQMHKLALILLIWTVFYFHLTNFQLSLQYVFFVYS